MTEIEFLLRNIQNRVIDIQELYDKNKKDKARIKELESKGEPEAKEGE